MVKQDQLRIGNWLRTTDGSYGTIESLAPSILIETFSGTFEYACENLFPISVDTNILSLCDFQFSNAFYVHKDSNLHLKYYGDDKWQIIHGENTVAKFEYLHELQNMYFDIFRCYLTPNLIGI